MCGAQADTPKLSATPNPGNMLNPSNTLKLSYKLTSGKEIFLVPYKRGGDHKAFLFSLLTTKGVYDTLRDGRPWTFSLIETKDASYATQNNHTLKLLSSQKIYTADTFGVCWIVQDSSGKMLGRGGFQPEDSLDPVETEVYLALLPEAQEKGIGKGFVKAVTAWFRAHVNNKVRIRGLALKDNIASQKMLQSNGYKKQLGASGKPFETEAWGRRYEVFEYRG